MIIRKTVLSDMDQLMKRIIDHMKADSELEDLEGKYR